MLSGQNNLILMLLIVVGPAMIVFGVLQLVGDLRGTQRKKLQGRLQGTKSRSASSKVTVEDLRKTANVASGTLGQAFSKMSFAVHLQKVLDQANVSWHAPKVLVNLTAVAAVLMAVAAVLNLGMLVALGVGVGAWTLPLLWLYWKRNRRLKRMVNQLPDVFELLSQALRAGHSLASGMQLVAQEMPDPAGTEFGRVFQEQNLGLTIENALTNLADRVDMLDVRFFVTAVLIQRQTGGDLAEVLDKIGTVIRDRIKLHGTVMALTAEGRLSGYVLLALPVAVFMALQYINPDYAGVLLHHPTGQMMLIGAILGELLGWAMIKQIINVKV